MTAFLPLIADKQIFDYLDTGFTRKTLRTKSHYVRLMQNQNLELHKHMLRFTSTLLSFRISTLSLKYCKMSTANRHHMVSLALVLTKECSCVRAITRYFNVIAVFHFSFSVGLDKKNCWIFKMKHTLSKHYLALIRFLWIMDTIWNVTPYSAKFHFGDKMSYKRALRGILSLAVCTELFCGELSHWNSSVSFLWTSSYNQSIVS